jgi:hypothetical protein
MLKVLVRVTSIFVLAITSVSAQSVTVRPGDTLSKIAARELGDGSRWAELCELNRSSLQGGCDELEIGTDIRLDAPPQGDDTTRAPAPASVSSDVPTDRQTRPETLEEPRREDTLSGDAQFSSSEVLVPTSQIDPELITVEETTLQQDGESILLGRLSTSAGVHRIRYGFTPAGNTAFRVEWNIQTQLDFIPNVTIYGSASDVLGRVYLVQPDEATSDGSVSEASNEPGEDGWVKVTFNLDVPKAEPFVQLLFYPLGTSELAPEQQRTIKFSKPEVFAIN